MKNIIIFIKKHKNFSLLVLLIIGVLLTYLFEERANKIKEVLNAKKTALLNVEDYGELKGVKGIKINFEKRGETFSDRENHLRLSTARLDEFFQILSGLKVINFLNQEDVKKIGIPFYIPDESMKMTFEFEKGSLTFILGKKLDFDQTFYMQVISGDKNQVVLVKDESPDPNIYENDEQYKKSDAKFKRLQMVFLLTNKYFYDGRVFKDFDYSLEKINFESIQVSTFRNKKYSINFKDSTTNPPAPPTLGYFDDNWVSFHQALSKLEAKNVNYPADPKLLDEVLSFFEVVDRNGKKYTLEVYKKYGEEIGYFLKSSLDNIIYQLKPEDAQFFFVNVQDFWHKNYSPKNKDYDFTLVDYKGKSLSVAISDKELFTVKSIAQSKSAATDLVDLEFKRLIEFLKMEGNHVSEMNEKPTEIIKKTVLNLNFDNKKLNVILEENEAIVVDISQKVKIHYYVGNKLPFSIKIEDYIRVK
jgi:hypothetical protein